MDPFLGPAGKLGKGLGLIDGASEEEEDETSDCRWAGGEDRAGRAAGTSYGRGPDAGLADLTTKPDRPTGLELPAGNSHRELELRFR